MVAVEGPAILDAFRHEVEVVVAQTQVVNMETVDQVVVDKQQLDQVT